MDVLSATGLINYFGKWTNVTKVSVPPLLLRKGCTTAAIYGLSYMNDQRLSRLMRNDKVNIFFFICFLNLLLINLSILFYFFFSFLFCAKI